MKKSLLRTSLFLCLVGVFPLFPACGGGSEEDSDNDSDSDSDSDRGGDGDGLNLGGSNGQGGDNPLGECGGEDVEADPIPANVLLIVDTSASMEGTPDGFELSKWDTLVSSLQTALPEVEDVLHLGLKFFPSGDTDSDVCSVESGVEVNVAAGVDSVPEIASALEDQVPGGDTPTAAALADALEYFQNGAGQDLEGDRYVLLATDGGPNCSSEPAVDCTCTTQSGPDGNPGCGEREMCTLNIDEVGPCTLDGDFGSCCDVPELCLDDGGTIDAVSALASAGIKTIVVGMPGSEAYTDVLDSLAVAGELPASSTSPRYTRVDDPEGLTAALRDLTRAVIRSCEVQLEEEPQNRDRVNVYLDGTVIYKDDEDGWRYVGDESPPLIEIVGETCEQVEREGVEKISVKYGCAAVVR